VIWWIICFGAVTVTIFAKWYFADNLSRLRRNLSRQHREALEIKDALQDARKTYQDTLLLNRSKEIDISRTRKHLADLRLELRTPTKESKKQKRNRRM
jgi:hypothetical protein